MDNISFAHDLHGKKEGFEYFPFVTEQYRLGRERPVIPLHDHKEMELICVTEGAGTVSVDLEPFPVKKGNIVLVLPGQLHLIEADRREGMVCESTVLRPEMLMGPDSDPCTRDFFLPLLEGKTCLPQLISPSFEWYFAFADCLAEAKEICRYYPNGYPLAVKSRLFQMFYILFFNAALPLPRTRPRKSLEKARFILRYIGGNYRTHHLSVETAAQACCLSESHFIRFFKSAVGMTFVEYLNEYRLSESRQLLLEPEHSVSDVTRLSGFENPSYFARLFKRRYHITPSQYRKQNSAG